MNEATCPYCDAALDSATDPYGTRRPNAGDLTVCIVCAQLCAFTDNMLLRKLTPKEEQDAMSHDHIKKLVAAVRKIDRRTINS